MKISEILYDAAKYPFSGIRQLLLLGFMILMTTSILGYSNQFYNYLNSIFGFNGLILFILLIILAVILLFLEAGYAFRIIEHSIIEIDKPPKLNNLRNMFKHGINETILIIMYLAVPLTILIYVLDYTLYGITIETSNVSLEITILFISVAFFIGFLADMFFTVCIPHMAFKGGDFKEAFNFPEIFKKIKEIGLRKLFLAYIIVILGIFIIGGPLLIGIIGKTNLIGFIVAEELIAPYLIMLDSRFITLLYKEST
jgi:hypothetical protein